MGAVTGGILTSGAGAVATGGGGLWRLPDELDAWVDVAAAASCASRRSSFLYARRESGVPAWSWYCRRPRMCAA